MDYSPILVPVVALVAWSLVMQVWMYVTPLRGDEARGSARQGAARRRAASISKAVDARRANGKRTITRI